MTRTIISWRKRWQYLQNRIGHVLIIVEASHGGTSVSLFSLSLYIFEIVHNKMWVFLNSASIILNI